MRIRVGQFIHYAEAVVANRPEQYSELKKALTFQQQLDLLRSRNLIITNKQEALAVLKRVNYYRLSGYMLSLSDNDVFRDGVCFRDVYSLYRFDKDLRALLLFALEDVETSFRTQIAYLLAHKYGPEGYRNGGNFLDARYHEELLAQLQKAISSSKEKFVAHHKQKYGARFPVWVAIELSSFGLLSRIYGNLRPTDSGSIARQYYGIGSGAVVASWLHSLAVLRNVCAHLGRLYDRRLPIAPKLHKQDAGKGIKNDRLFAFLLAMGRLSLDKTQWNAFVTRLSASIEQYPQVQLKCLGFPDGWETMLRDL